MLKQLALVERDASSFRYFWDQLWGNFLSIFQDWILDREDNDEDNFRRQHRIESNGLKQVCRGEWEKGQESRLVPVGIFIAISCSCSSCCPPHPPNLPPPSSAGRSSQCESGVQLLYKSAFNLLRCYLRLLSGDLMIRQNMPDSEPGGRSFT